MIELNLPDMSCGHCVSTVAQACKLVDPTAKVEIDLGAKLVRIRSAEDRMGFVAALTDAGYPPSQ